MAGAAPWAVQHAGALGADLLARALAPTTAARAASSTPWIYAVTPTHLLASCLLLHPLKEVSVEKTTRPQQQQQL